MKYVKILCHFLGGVYFAIILIGTVALFVIAGTLIESKTESHRYAALLTYENPFFSLLLLGFFVNILFSSLRRWPFQTKHLGFLITHLGLLMVIAGSFSKHYFGLQGNMRIVEGSGSHFISNPSTESIYVEKAGEKEPKYYPLQKALNKPLSKLASTEDGLRLNLIAYSPNSTEKVETWIKQDHGSIFGFNKIPLSTLNELIPEKVILHQANFPHPSTVWDVYAIRTPLVKEVIEALYLKDGQLLISKRQGSSSLPTTIALKTANLNLNFSLENGCISPELQVKILAYSHLVSIPLSGPGALLNKNLSTPYLGEAPYAVDISRPPTLVLIEDETSSIHFIVMDAVGRIWWKKFNTGMPETLIAYDRGFKGYGALAKDLLIDSSPPGRKVIEKALQYRLKNELVKAEEQSVNFSLPLKLLQSACRASQSDFSTTVIDFLNLWNASHQWIYPENIGLTEELASTFKNFDWTLVPKEDLQGCIWTSKVFLDLDPDLQTGRDALLVLEDKKWPLIPFNEVDPLTVITTQIFAAAKEERVLKEFIHPTSSPEANARLFSAYLRAYSIHLSTIIPTLSESEMESLLNEIRGERKNLPLTFETFLSKTEESVPPEKKIENNRPKITIHARKNGNNQTFSLRLDPNATELKWPILNGEYLVRFQPLFNEIPYHVRLRNARQINYPNSTGVFSFESDLLITDRRTNTTIETTISMNRVYETSDGYRFYLSGMAPAEETAIKQVQIVVNYDPTKYFLTYLGGCILSLGIIILFTRKS